MSINICQRIHRNIDRWIWVYCYSKAIDNMRMIRSWRTWIPIIFNFKLVKKLYKYDKLFGLWARFEMSHVRRWYASIVIVLTNCEWREHRTHKADSDGECCLAAMWTDFGMMEISLGTRITTLEISSMDK